MEVRTGQLSPETLFKASEADNAISLLGGHYSEPQAVTHIEVLALAPRMTAAVSAFELPMHPPHYLLMYGSMFHMLIEYEGYPGVAGDLDKAIPYATGLLQPHSDWESMYLSGVPIRSTSWFLCIESP